MSNEVAYWPRYLDALGKELERRGLPFCALLKRGVVLWQHGNHDPKLAAEGESKTPVAARGTSV